MRGLAKGLRWMGLVGVLVLGGCQGPSLGKLVVEVVGLEAAVSPPMAKLYNQSNQEVARQALSGTWQADFPVGSYRLVPSVAQAELPGGQSASLYPQPSSLNLSLEANQTSQVRLEYAPDNANFVGTVSIPASLSVQPRLTGPEVRTLTSGENRLYGLPKGGYSLEAPTTALGSDGKLYRLQVQGLPVEAGSKAYHTFSVSYFADPNENWCTAGSAASAAQPAPTEASMRQLAAKVLNPPSPGMGDFSDIAPGRLIIYRNKGKEQIGLTSVYPGLRSLAKLATGWEIVEVKEGSELEVAHKLIASGVALRVEPDRYLQGPGRDLILADTPAELDHSSPAELANLSTPTEFTNLSTPPNDPLYNLPIGNNVDKTPKQVLAVHGMEAGWNILKPGCPAVVVAVIDDGVADTPFLRENLWPNLTPLASWFDAGKVQQGTVNYTGHPHGVSVAGIIAGVANDGKEYLGLGYNLVKVLPIAFNLTVSGSMLGIQYAMGQVSAGGQTFTNPSPAKVVNMSFSGSEDSARHDLIKLAVAQGLVFVGASGNQSSSSVRFPAAFPEVIAAGGYDSNQVPAIVRHPMSNYGSALDFVAPFQHYMFDIDRVWSWMGTSLATPSIASLVALHLYAAQHFGPAWDKPAEVYAQVYSCLKSAANPTFDEQIGWGAPRLDKILDPANPACYK